MLILTIRTLPSGSATLYDMLKPEVSPLLLHICHTERSQTDTGRYAPMSWTNLNYIWDCPSHNYKITTWTKFSSTYLYLYFLADGIAQLV